MKPEWEDTILTKQLGSLPPEKRAVIDRLLTESDSEEEPENFLEAWAKTGLYLLHEEIHGDIRDKFAWPLHIARDLAAEELGVKEYNFHILVDSDTDDRTDFAVIDWERKLTYLIGDEKHWRFKFDKLEEFADLILKWKTEIVESYRSQVLEKEEK